MLWILALTVGILVIVGAGMILELKGQVERYKAYWHQQKNAKADANAIHYFAIGDSAAQGIGASEPDRGYVGLVAANLAQTSRLPVNIINLSSSGATVKTAVEGQLPELKRYQIKQEDVVTVVIGANDMRLFDEREFRKKYEELLAGLPPQTVVANLPYFGGGIFRHRENDVLTANKIIAELTSKHKLKLADLHSSTKNNDSWKNYSIDLFHPSNQGYKWWAEALLDAI